MSNNLLITVLRPSDVNNSNTDDSGAPKSCVVGGANRLRHSSQSCVRPVREGLHTGNEIKYGGIRTKLLEIPLKDNLIELGCSEAKATELATAVSDLIIGKKKKASAKAKGAEASEDSGTTLGYFMPSEIMAIADFLKNNKWSVESASDKKAIDKVMTEVMKANSGFDAIDIALFGRMFARSQELSIEGCLYRSHSYTTHRSEIDVDYFSALDDLDDKSNASHLGTKEFGGGIYVSTWILNLDQLRTNLGGTAKPEEIRSIARDVINQIMVSGYPKGKRTHALTNCLPSYAIAAVYNGAPCAVSFETPVEMDSNGGHLANSIIHLDAEIKRILSFAESVKGTEVVADSTGFDKKRLEKVLSYV